jgi:deoxyribodipyrimidine photo-lyase
VVDAAMRQLLDEGWMSNRARMVVASFLTRDLRVDWRVGAAHFQEHLVDGDLASNAGNWQWIAGTGTDTGPRRAFNPTRQGRQHDPSGDWVRRFVPELSPLPARLLHDPPPQERRSLGYPRPIVRHDAARRVRTPA